MCVDWYDDYYTYSVQQSALKNNVRFVQSKRFEVRLSDPLFGNSVVLVLILHIGCSCNPVWILSVRVYTWIVDRTRTRGRWLVKRVDRWETGQHTIGWYRAHPHIPDLVGHIDLLGTVVGDPGSRKAGLAL